jgi:RNA polymerase sigma factor (sigma-70 family)
VVEATAAVRRVIGARVRDPHDREDLVQETLVKVAAAQERLGTEALQGYAIVTARHVVIGHFRRQTTRRRHVHRLVDYNRLDGPEELTLQREETDALAAALSGLPSNERALLLAHEVDGLTTADLAAQHDSTPGGIAVRLARARARLRVEFLLAFRNVELPTGSCRPVLLSLSTGERRRQTTLRAGEHLLACPVCASLSEPIVERRRSIAAFIPVLGLGLLTRLRRAARSGKVQAATGVAASASVVAFVVFARAPSGVARPRPVSTAPTTVAVPRSVPRSSPLVSGRQMLLPIPAGGLAAFAGRPVEAQHLLVLSVPADEGAWLGTDPGNRVWVEFVGTGESPFDIRVGQHLTFRGELARNPPSYAQRVGLPLGSNASALTRAGVHIDLPYASVEIDDNAG